MTPDTRREERRARGGWGLGDALRLWVAQFVGSAIWVLLLVGVFYGGTAPSPIPVWLLAIGQIPLWLCYGLGPVITTRTKGNGPVIDLGARVERNDLPVGVAIGVVLQLAVLPIIYWPILRFVDTDPGESARELVDEANGIVSVLVLTVVVAVAAPLFEEFFFRGLLFRGLLRRFSPAAAVVLSSAGFALVHIEPILFPGTFVLGVVAAIASLKTGRLGPAWGMHLGFNAITLIALLADLPV